MDDNKANYLMELGYRDSVARRGYRVMGTPEDGSWYLLGYRAEDEGSWQELGEPLTGHNVSQWSLLDGSIMTEGGQ